MKRALHDARQIGGAIDAIHAFAERPVDLALIGVLMEVELLVGMAAVVMGRNVAGDHNHRDRIERGVGDAGCGIGQARAEMAQHHAGSPGGARVAVGRVRRDLFVAARDEPDAALAERIEHRDVRVAAEAEDDFDAEPLEILHHQVGGDAGRGRAWGFRLGQWSHQSVLATGSKISEL